MKNMLLPFKKINSPFVFIKSKSRIFILLTIILVLLVTSFLLSKQFYIFGFSTLVILFTLSGLGFAKFLKNQLAFKDIVGYLTNALIFGIIANIIGLQISGLLGIEFSNVFLIYFWAFLALINIIYCLYSPYKDIDYQLPVISRKNGIDFIWFVLIMGFFFIIAQICLEHFIPNWDSFTFWGVDAKYLYENRTLRDSSFARLYDLPYSSVYPSLFFLTYVLLGGIYEQFASLISVLFAFLSFMLLFNRFRYQDNTLIKNISYLSIVFILTTFLTLQSILVSMYSEVFCSFLVLLFTLVLTRKKIEIDDYYKRFIILANLSFSFYLVKTPYFSITIPLIAIWLISDVIYFRKDILKVLKDREFILATVFQGIFFYSMWRYISSLTFGTYATYLTQNIGAIRDYVAYIFTLLSHIAENIPLILMLYGVFAMYFLVFLFKNRKVFLSSFVFVVVTFIPMGIFMYMLSNDFMSKSLIRYISLGFFVLPYIFMSVKQNNFEKIQGVFSTLLTFSIAILCMYFIFFSYGLNLKIDLSSGSYIDAMPQHYYLAEKVKSFVGDEIVTIVDETDEGSIGDVGVPSIYVKYYLFYNNSRSSYRVPVESFYQFYKEYDSDYLLILQYDGYWEECNNILKINSSYLVRKDNIDFDSGSSCPFESVLIEI